MNKYVVGLLLIIVIILLGGLGFFILQNQKLIGQLSNEASTTETPALQTSQSPAPSPSPSPTMTKVQLQENIEAAVNTGNTQPLGTYMTTPKVNVSLMSTECCEPMTPDEAVLQMEYIKDGVPLDFNQNNPIVKNIKAKKPEFANSFIGVSKSGEQTAIFTIDANNKISAIQLSASYTFYDF